MDDLAEFLEFIFYNKHSKKKNFAQFDREKMVKEFEAKSSVLFRSLVETKSSVHIAGKNIPKNNQAKLERLKEVFNLLKEDMRQLGDKIAYSYKNNNGSTLDLTFSKFVEDMELFLENHQTTNNKVDVDLQNAVGLYEAVVNTMGYTAQESLSGISFEKFSEMLGSEPGKIKEKCISSAADYFQNIISNMSTKGPLTINKITRTGSNVERHFLGIKGSNADFDENFTKALNEGLSQEYWEQDTQFGKASVKRGQWHGKGKVQITSDITIETSDNNNFGLTLKNYLNDGIHFRNYNLIQYLQNVIFLESFNNIFFRYMFWNPYTFESDDEYAQNKSEMFQWLKIGIILTAIFGADGNNQAQILIVNIRSMQRVYALSVKKVYDALLKTNNTSGVNLPEESLERAHGLFTLGSFVKGLPSILAKKVNVSKTMSSLFK